MSFQVSPYATLLFVAAAASGVFAWYALRRRQQREALIFGLLMLALAWWSLLYGLHMCATTLEGQHLFNRLKYLGVLAVPPLWVILALQYTGHQATLTHRNIALIFLPAIILLPIVLTDHWTHLWWSKLWLEDFDGLPVLKNKHTISYYINVAISYIYVIWGLMLYVRLYRRTERIYRSQATLIVIAAAFPLIASVITQLGFSPLPWGLDSFFFTISSLLIAVAIFRYRFLDIVPVARWTVVEQIPEGVIVVDAGNRIMDTNPAARAFMAMDKKQIIGRPLVTAIEIPELRQALLELTSPKGKQGTECDVHMSTPDGERVISLSTTPLAHGTTGPFGQIIVLRDISERVAAQRALETLYRQAEVERERLALTIRTATDAIVLLDAEGQVLASNPPAERVLQARHSSQFPPDLQVLLDRAREAAGVTEAQIDVGEQSFHAAAAPIVGTGLVLTMHDVTHFRQLAQMKDEFVSTVSHDLRTPLTAIRGYAQLAQLETAPDHKRKNALERIETVSQHMADLISDLLDLATLEAGEGYETAPVDLGELARAAADAVEGAALAKGVTIRYDLDQLPLVAADPRLLAQVWRNLIDNAIKYTDKGTITIRAKTTGDAVLGQVVDTGIGISSTDLPYVFDKFYRSKQPYTRGITGTGLGLALVKTIVEKHSGRLWVESELGVGSTFTFTLPTESESYSKNIGSQKVAQPRD